MTLVLQVFGQKAKYWTNEDFHLMVALDERFRDHQSFCSLF